MFKGRFECCTLFCTVLCGEYFVVEYNCVIIINAKARGLGRSLLSFLPKCRKLVFDHYALVVQNVLPYHTECSSCMERSLKKDISHQVRIWT